MKSYSVEAALVAIDPICMLVSGENLGTLSIEGGAMTVTVSDSFNVRDKLTKLGCPLSDGLVLLPEYIESAVSIADVRQLSESGTIRSLFRQVGIPLVDVFNQNQRPPYIQNNDVSWVAPTLFVAAGVLSENPNLVSVAYGVLTNYLTDFFKGKKGASTQIKASFIVETTKQRAYKELKYEGPVSGLAEFAELVRSTQDDNKN